MREALLFVLNFLLLAILVFGFAFFMADLEAKYATPCAIDGKPCEPRRECVISCARCEDKDNCCCKHVDRCSCIEPATGERCCDGK